MFCLIVLNMIFNISYKLTKGYLLKMSQIFFCYLSKLQQFTACQLGQMVAAENHILNLMYYMETWVHHRNLAVLQLSYLR